MASAHQPNETLENSSGISHIEQQQQAIAVDPDLSADTQRYFAKARSTPIIYSTSCSSTSASSSSSVQHNVEKQKQSRIAHDNRSLCSAHSFTAAQQQQQQQQTESSQSSTRHQTFHFGTPLPPQRQQPYQYHEGAYGNEWNTPPWQTPTPQPQASTNDHHLQMLFLQSNATTRVSATSGGASINTARSWRQKRINILKQQQLPDFETKVFCQECEKFIQTRIRYLNGSLVWLMSFILLLCTVILFWVPFYVKYFKDVAHFCPGCGKRLGVSYRL